VTQHHHTSPKENAMLGNYLRWLQVLMALGPKLPKILEALKALMDAIGDVIPPPPVPGPGTGGLALTYGAAFTATEDGGSMTEGSAIPAEVLDAEGQVIAMTTAAGGTMPLGDGAGLRKLFDWLNSAGLGGPLFQALIGALLKKLIPTA
jgi:hypothetical protein